MNKTTAYLTLPALGSASKTTNLKVCTASYTAIRSSLGEYPDCETLFESAMPFVIGAFLGWQAQYLIPKYAAKSTPPITKIKTTMAATKGKPRSFSSDSAYFINSGEIRQPSRAGRKFTIVSITPSKRSWRTCKGVGGWS